MRFTTVAAAVAVLCLAAPAARAQSAPPFTHQGLYLRLEGGLGYLHATADFDSTSATAYGGAGYLGLSLGGAVGESTVLYGELWGMSAVHPTVQFAGFTGTANDQTLNYGGLGIGLGFFIMPSNVMFAVSLNLTRLGVTNTDGSSSNSDIGLALAASLGKQFWVTERLGLGIALKVIGGGNRDDNNKANSTTYRTISGVGVLALTFG